MKEKPTVHVYPSDASGCGQYRMILPGEFNAKGIGNPVVVLPRHPQIVVDDKGNIHGINVGGAEVVVFQRPGQLQLQRAIELLHENKVATVIDMDDNLSKIHPRNSAFKSYDPRVSRNLNWMHAERACEMADLITVTSDALADFYAKHGRVVILPNCIPASNLRIPKSENEVPVVGWAGYTGTHPTDLFVTHGAINDVLIKTGARFMAFGDNNIFTHLKIRAKAPHIQRSFTGFQDYHRTLAEMDIGLVPLEKSEFNDAKSYLKALEYASVGVVPVVTPTRENQKLVDIGMAVPAATPKEWAERVGELITDTEYRLEMSKKVRELATEHTIEKNAHKWYQAWKSAYEYRQTI